MECGRRRCRSGASHRRVALVAERLPLVGTHLYIRSPSVMAGRGNRPRGTDSISRRSKSASEGGFTSGGLCSSGFSAWRASGIAMVVHQMAIRQTITGRLAIAGSRQASRALRIDRGYQVANAAVVVRAVAAQAIVHQQPFWLCLASRKICL